MYNTISTLRRKIVFTILILIGYRFLCHIPLPFIDREYLSSIMSASGAVGMFNMLTGGNLESMSVIALGVTPYITASIIIQLLCAVLPGLAQIQRDGAAGREKIQRATLVMSFVFAAVESLGIIAGYGRSGLLTEYNAKSVFITVFILAVCTSVLSFAGQMIEKHFFGDGISLVLTVGIVSSYLSDGESLYEVLSAGKALPQTIAYVAVAGLCIFGLFMFTVWLNSCEEYVDINYSKKAPVDTAGCASVIPLKLMSGSVVPVIFAASIISVPGFIGLFMKDKPAWFGIFDMSQWFGRGEWWTNIGMVIYFLLIIYFSHYYQSLNMNEKDMAKALREHGGVIDGVSPGQPTEKYLKEHMANLATLSGLYLCIIAALPIVAGNLLGIPKLGFFGTSVIIVVSIAMSTIDKYIAARKGLSHKTRDGHTAIYGVRSLSGR